MVRISVVSVILFVCTVTALPAWGENLLTHATIESYTSAAGGRAGVEALYDGSLNVPWTNAPLTGRPFEFVWSWDMPVIIGGIRVAVPGGGDTSVCARDLKVEILPEGHLDYVEIKHVRIQPREGFQSFLLPALPTRHVRLTILQNYGNPVTTYLSELELLNPLDAGHRESMPGWVSFSAGQLWLYNSMDDNPAPPVHREALSDQFGMVTGDGGEATVILSDHPSPFGEGKGMIVQVGGFTSFLADRYYDGKPRYRFLVASGDLTVYTLHDDAEAEFYTREGVFRLTGNGSASIKTAPTWGTSVEVRSGELSCRDLRANGFPTLDLSAGECIVLTPSPLSSPDTANAISADRRQLLPWFGTLSAMAGAGAEVKWVRQARNVQSPDRGRLLPPQLRAAVAGNNDPDTLPPLIGEQLALLAEPGQEQGAPLSAPAWLFARAHRFADFILYDNVSWERIDADLDGAALAAALHGADIRVGIDTKRFSLQPYGENRRPARLAVEVGAAPVVDLVNHYGIIMDADGFLGLRPAGSYFTYPRTAHGAEDHE